ncbi:hypothetical protein Tco_0393728 [Tanacetum coccineum]
MGSNEEIVQLLQKTQTIFKQTQRDKEEKYLNDIIQLQDKIKDLENVVCKMGRSTDTLRLLTNEQKAFRDNLRKSGVGYNGSCVLSQAYAKIPKLYRAYELCDKNEQLHVFDSEETLEDAEKSQLKMNEFQKDEKIQELKIQPIDYEKLNKLYKEFVPQKQLSEPSVKQTCSSPYSIPFVKILETKTMPSELPLINELFNIKVGFEKLSLLIHQNSKRESIFYTSKAEIERNDFCREKVKPLLNELQVYFDDFQNLFQRDIKEMKDAFEQNDVYLDEIENQNDLLKDQLLEASLTEDIKNLVITSCVEIRNKDLHDEIERISKESKDVSNESKTVDTACNDAFEVKQELSKRIVELEKDLSKSEAKGIAFEIALQHKSQENNSLITVQKENENFMASLQLENAHLKQTYKDLFESVQRSKVEIKQCDEVKVKDDFDEIETRNIELEYRVASLIKENEHLKLTYENLFDSIKKSRFKNILEKIEFFKKKQLDISELNMESGENVCDNAKCEFLTKFVELEKVDDSKAKKDQFLKEINHLRTQLENLKGESVQTKFDKHSILGKPPADKLLINSQISKSWFTPNVDVQTSLSKPVTTQSLPKNEKDQLLKQIAYLESKLARSCQKEYHELRTSYNALKVKFDSLNRQKWNINVSKSSKPKESVSEKVHTGESSKPFSQRVSQFTTYSLQKDRKFSKKSQSFETFSPHKGFKTRASNENNQSFETSHSCFTPEKIIKTKSEQNQSKPTKKRKRQDKREIWKDQSRISPIQGKKANESQRTNVDKFSKFKGLFGSF